jgi:predicted Zn-dependent protease
VLGGILKTNFSITDGNSITNTASRTFTLTVTGAAVNATVIINPRTALTTGLGIGYAYVSALNTIKLNIINTSTASTSLGTVTFDITVIQ